MTRRLRWEKRLQRTRQRTRSSEGEGKQGTTREAGEVGVHCSLGCAYNDRSVQYSSAMPYGCVSRYHPPNSPIGASRSDLRDHPQSFGLAPASMTTCQLNAVEPD